ncbi:hypothetical protein PV328_004634 [Microctonus aethiopoides]|uniref:Uncharacterized protein n=1 Tax=Microctonus aethiopoides TaxID=144406 RepID=A0AA39KLR6_9HYME|nr:hypothetical protein PV328_004634 [Microctonus aethiopoides]
MTHSLNQPRRPSVSIYEYPEDLNPFKDDEMEQVELRKPYIPLNNEKSGTKEHKQKFWTFGKSRKKRSNSFSIKSTWNGIFGKRKDCDGSERKQPEITTVSSTYRNTSCNPETVASRLSTDHQEFNQALWTLARRRKYTLDNSSRYSSSLTVNGDPRRIYDGCPQDTTASIMGDLTPKPPARRFGQASPKPNDEIPPLNYQDHCQIKNTEDDDCNMPVPPKRSGIRSSQRLCVPSDIDENNSSIRNDTMIDENENIPEDCVFKRFNRSAVQKSNLSINSCISMSSVYHSGRKKRRAPQPPVDTNANASLQQSKEESNIQADSDTNDNRKNLESIDIVKEAENIDEMTKRNQILDNNSTSVIVNNNNLSLKMDNEIENSSLITDTAEDSNENTNNSLNDISIDDTSLKVELKKEMDECVEIVKDVDLIEDIDDIDVVLRKKESLGNLSSNESFCVKEEIEKIEKQIKLLETNKIRSRTCSLSNYDDDDILDNVSLQRSASRRSLQENRRNFFRDLTRNNKNDRVKIEIKELPREQNDIKIVRLSESPTCNVSSTINNELEKPVKVIELHISEPIKRKPEFTISKKDINPIPKPRRHNALQINNNNQINVNESLSNNSEEDEMSASSM